MSYEECRRILNVSADATPKTVRQAYLDLARVWHPDRFQSDERLRKIAEDRFREVNQAYEVLRKYRPPVSSPDPGQGPGSEEFSGGDFSAAPPPFRRPFHDRFGHRPFRCRTHFQKISESISQNAGYAAIVILVLALPFLAASQLANLLRVPSLDTNLISSGGFQSKYLSPMQAINPRTDILSAAQALTRWSRAEASDFSRPVRHGFPKSPAATDRKMAQEGNRKYSVATTTPQVPPPNGTELISAGNRTGVGELRLSNHTVREVVFELVSNRLIRRAVYVAPNESATLRFIPVGVYALHVELGTDLDVQHLAFRSDRRNAAPLGPFQFQQVTSETGITGNHYDVVLNPQSVSQQ